MTALFIIIACAFYVILGEWLIRRWVKLEREIRSASVMYRARQEQLGQKIDGLGERMGKP